MTYLLVSVWRKSCWRPRDRTVLYRITEAVGRWSMIDVLGDFDPGGAGQTRCHCHDRTGRGALAFAAVVIITMFAAMSFDPRLIWDALEPR